MTWAELLAAVTEAGAVIANDDTAVYLDEATDDSFVLKEFSRGGDDPTPYLTVRKEENELVTAVSSSVFVRCDGVCEGEELQLSFYKTWVVANVHMGGGGPLGEVPTVENENCLAGKWCPECGQSEAFNVMAASEFTLEDAGTSEHGDVEYDEDSFASCPVCGWRGKWRDCDVDPAEEERVEDKGTKVIVEWLRGPRLLSRIMCNAGLGLTGVGVKERAELIYAPGEEVDEARVMKAVTSTMERLDKENSESAIFNPEVISIEKIR